MIVKAKQLSALVDVRRTHHPVDGYRTVFTYEGLARDIAALEYYFRRLGAQVEFNQNSPVATLEAIFSSPQDGTKEEPVNAWELLGNNIQNKSTQHPTFMAYAADTQQNILREYQRYLTWQNANDKTKFTVALASDQKEFWRLMVLGQDVFYHGQYVLRHTQTVSREYQLKLAHVGIMKIWTTAQVKAAEVSMTDAIEYSVDQIESEKPAEQTGFESGWLKQTPTITERAGNKIEVTQEWWFDNWSTLYYAVQP